MVQLGPLLHLSHKAAIKVLARTRASCEASLGKDPLPNSCGCWQDAVPCGLLDEGCSSLIEIGKKLSPVLCHVGLLVGKLASSKPARESLQPRKMEVITLHNIIAKVTFHHLCHILIEEYSSSHLNSRAGVTQRCKFQEAEIIAGCTGVCLLQSIAFFGSWLHSLAPFMLYCLP